MFVIKQFGAMLGYRSFFFFLPPQCFQYTNVYWDWDSLRGGMKHSMTQMCLPTKFILRSISHDRCSQIANSRKHCPSFSDSVISHFKRHLEMNTLIVMMPKHSEAKF